jgi:hypothetical protein
MVDRFNGDGLKANAEDYKNALLEFKKIGLQSNNDNYTIILKLKCHRSIPKLLQ